jgi:nucleoside-diphosphate-sugar epimerase
MKIRKRILITGGAGFIGSNLSKVLLNKGEYVDCVDNLITGRIEAINSLRSYHRFRFFKLDVSDTAFFNTFIDNKYTDIYHLACPTGVPNIKTFGEEMLKTCSSGTENILRLACAHNAKVLYSSSAEVYGNPEIFPQSEDYHGNVNPVGPRSAYEEGKRFSEALIVMYVDKYKIDAKIVRIFNTFGIGMSQEDSRVIPRFLKNIRKGENLVIYGDGSQTRTHLYVDDLISGLLLVMERGCCGGVYNIGGEEQLSVADLAIAIKKLSNATVDIEYHPHFIEDHSDRLPMTTKVKALGWKPIIKVAEGLLRMLSSYGIPVNINNEAIITPTTENQPIILNVQSKNLRTQKKLARNKVFPDL